MGATKAKGTPAEHRLSVARTWCRDTDPLVRGRGLELASRLGRKGHDLVWAALEDRDAATRQAAIGLAARPEVAAREAAEHRRASGAGAFTLERVEDLLDGVGHARVRCT